MVLILTEEIGLLHESELLQLIWEEYLWVEEQLAEVRGPLPAIPALWSLERRKIARKSAQPELHDGVFDVLWERALSQDFSLPSGNEGAGSSSSSSSAPPPQLGLGLAEPGEEAEEDDAWGGDLCADSGDTTSPELIPSDHEL